MAGASELEKAIERLTKKERGWEQFKPAPQVGGRPGTRTTGRPSASGGGAAGSFVEADAALREYYDERQVASTDGVFVLRFKPIKKIVGDDGRALEFKEPPAS